MRGLAGLLLALACVTVLGPERADACSSVRSNARITVFECPCPGGEGQQPELTPIYVVEGVVALTNRRATPTLGSLVVELHARVNRKLRPVAALVLNAAGSTVVDTCQGAFASGPVPGRIVLTDAEGNEISFADVAALPEGTTVLRYVATFAGFLPGLEPRARARVKTYVTSIGGHGSRTCSVDADGDGVNDAGVQTLTFRRAVRVPAASSLITP